MSEIMYEAMNRGKLSADNQWIRQYNDANLEKLMDGKGAPPRELTWSG